MIEEINLDLKEKAKNVIMKCVTPPQLKTAHNYIDLLEKNHSLPPDYITFLRVLAAEKWEEMDVI